MCSRSVEFAEHEGRKGVGAAEWDGRKFVFDHVFTSRQTLTRPTVVLKDRGWAEWDGATRKLRVDGSNHRREWHGGIFDLIRRPCEMEVR